MIKKKIKRQKPIDNDIHFKYVCPNTNCLDVHWLSLKQTQTKNFKVVCDCGEIFAVKRIKDIVIDYHTKTQKQQKTSDTNQDHEFIDHAVKTLLGFGFSNDEASRMVADEYHRTAATNPALLVKNILDSFGGKNG